MSQPFRGKSLRKARKPNPFKKAKPAKERKIIGYRSNASWTEIPDSSDDHDTHSQAASVCEHLKSNYHPRWEENKCSIRGFCTRAWVTTIYEDEK